MNSIFYTGVSGMIGHQQNMDVLAHNMSNVNTVGFKPGRVEFSDLLYSRMAVNLDDKPMEGHGVKGDSVQTLQKQGNPLATGYGMDFAIMGDGYFAVEHEGERMYTRNGAFNISVEGRRGYLVNSAGDYVLDTRGKRVMLTSDRDTQQFDLSNLSEQIGVYRFDNPYALTATSGGFLATPEAGRVTSDTKGELPYTLIQNALESSAVDLSETMTEIITAQRAYQFNARVVQTGDQIEEILNGLR